MSTPTDDDLGPLLTETFRAHEHLADPERAVAIASSLRRPRHRGRLLLGAAAAVALVAGVTSYALTQESGNPAPVGVPRHVPQPPLPPLQTDAGNHALAVRATRQVARATPVYPGARRVGLLRFPELSDSRISTPLVPDDVVQTRLWAVAGTTPRAVAQWYADHPPRGFHTEGGHAGVGSEDSGAGVVDELTWKQPAGERLPPVHPWVEVFTTDVGGGRVGIRITIHTVAAPARPVASYVQDVRSIDVTSTDTHYGRVVQKVTRSTRVTAPDRLLRAAVVFNDLPGEAPVGPVNCPAIRDVYTDRIVFHTVTGDVVATARNQVGCLDGVTVQRDGRPVGPTLGDPLRLLRILGIHH